MPDFTIVGAEMVGLCRAWSAQKRGWKVALIDKDFDGDRASHGNAGGIAVSECIPLDVSGLRLQPLRWLLDPLGPLLIKPTHAPRRLPGFIALRKVADPANFMRIVKALSRLNNRLQRDFEPCWRTCA